MGEARVGIDTSEERGRQVNPIRYNINGEEDREKSEAINHVIDEICDRRDGRWYRFETADDHFWELKETFRLVSP